MLTATTTPTTRKIPIPNIATGFLLAIPPLCRRLDKAARACPVRAKARLIAPILCGAGAPAGCRAYPISGIQEPFLAPRCGAWPVPSPESEGNGAPSGAPSTSALRRARALRKRARHSALHRGDFCSRGPRFLGRGLAASPSPAGSLRSGRNAARSGPRASRVRGCEPRPRAPHLPHFRIASRSAPHEQVIGI